MRLAWMALPLYPCHRAVELGEEFSIGDVFEGIDRGREATMRSRISLDAFGSNSAARHPLDSFCPVAIYQRFGRFGAEWSDNCLKMIETKTKLVAKYFHEISGLMEKLAIAASLRD